MRRTPGYFTGFRFRVSLAPVGQNPPCLGSRELVHAHRMSDPNEIPNGTEAGILGCRSVGTSRTLARGRPDAVAAARSSTPPGFTDTVSRFPVPVPPFHRETLDEGRKRVDRVRSIPGARLHARSPVTSTERLVRSRLTMRYRPLLARPVRAILGRDSAVHGHEGVGRRLERIEHDGEDGRLPPVPRGTPRTGARSRRHRGPGRARAAAGRPGGPSSGRTVPSAGGRPRGGTQPTHDPDRLRNPGSGEFHFGIDNHAGRSASATVLGLRDAGPR